VDSEEEMDVIDDSELLEMYEEGLYYPVCIAVRFTRNHRPGFHLQFQTRCYSSLQTSMKAF
jgi:hypothetical protein